MSIAGTGHRSSTRKPCSDELRSRERATLDAVFRHARALSGAAPTTPR
jgi:hypothetical protein